MDKKPSLNIAYFIILAGISCISFGLFLWELALWPDLRGYVVYNALTSEDQRQILKCIISSFIVITPLVFLLLTICQTEAFQKMIAVLLKLLSVLFLLPFLLHKELFRTYPSLMMMLVTFLSFFIFFIFKDLNITCRSVPRLPAIKAFPYILLTLMILGYSVYFSYFTIINHYNLRTLTFDLAFFQNAFINTLHGHFMAVSFNPLNGASMFRDHYDFIMLLYLPFFYLIPKTETLLSVQCISIALAAVPLFLLTKKMLNSTLMALLVALLFFLYPANHCALFYDIHELSFLPLAVFSLFYALERKNILGFLASIIFLLSIKLDMYLLLIPISIFIYFNDNKNLNFSIYGLLGSLFYGILYFLFLKKMLIHSYIYCFGNLLINNSGGMDDILKTIVTNPLFLLKNSLTKDKIIFLCQIFGPLAFVPLMRPKNFLLFIYGLFVTLLSNTFHTIYFQYVWYLVPFIFIGLLYALKDVLVFENNNKALIPLFQNNIYPILIAVLFSSLIYSWQYGAILNRALFRGGFFEINFNFTPENKKRLQALQALINRIPPNALISASEDLTSHFTNQGNMKRYNEWTIEPDYLLINEPHPEGPNFESNLMIKKGYGIISREGGFLLLKKEVKTK